MSSDERFLSPVELSDDKGIINLRPRSLDEFVGQDRIKKRLDISIRAARARGEALDHILLSGPPGLGKTTLANIVSSELGSNIHTTSGPVIEKQGDLAAILTSIERFDVLFIDEIHRLSKTVEEILYSAMEDFQLDILIGKGPGARSIRIDIMPFTLVGATTRSGLIGAPLRNRFGMVLEMDFYSVEDLSRIIRRSSKLLEVSTDDDACQMLAERSRGTPRIANRLLKRTRDLATVCGSGRITVETVSESMKMLGIDSYGLDSMDRKILETLTENYGGGPAGVKALAASLGVEAETISEVYEPFLLQAGFLVRTSRGRMATDKTYEYLGIARKSSTRSLW
ncbi:MAG TPA: Holliday junction branch migration DNA helicase RuvB [Kosmotogaceae bacterium]|nr:MAG: Holliday junction ATP-dependent DNA helicase RuvB [Thermotogales bacterium 46_20]HAA85798.1 Holliday junction branch migration DNA helicase RuvB [Kosmotogaceae bacterium]